MKLLQADVNREGLRPLTDTRSVADIEIGGQTVYEHVQESLESYEHDVLTPEYLEDITEKNSEFHGLDREVNPELDAEGIVYNSSVIPEPGMAAEIDQLDTGEGLFYDDTFIAGISSGNLDYSDLGDYVDDLDPVQTSEDPMVLERPWDLVEHNGELIERYFDSGAVEGDLSEDAVIRGSKERLYIGAGATVGMETDEGFRGEVVIDTSEGPVIIDEGASVGVNTRITGPAYIGQETKVGAGDNAVIHEETHIGDVARAGGEIEGVVMQSFSNKYHHGFLGDSVVGSWVNFGAGTTNSDLKNTYGDVKVDLPGVEGTESAGQFFGTVIGDHSKFGIGTNIFTGKLVGPVAQVRGDVTENTGSFAWMTDGKQDYDPERAREHARRMMERREDELPEGYIETQQELLSRLEER